MLHKKTLGLKSQLRKQSLALMRSEKLKGSQETMMPKPLKLQTEKLTPTHTPCQSSGQGWEADSIGSQVLLYWVCWSYLPQLVIFSDVSKLTIITSTETIKLSDPVTHTHPPDIEEVKAEDHLPLYVEQPAWAM